MDNNFEETYVSLVTVPKHADVSVDTIRRFFNAYLSHKYVIDYLVELGTTELVERDWAYQSKARNVHEQLVKLQDILNYNVKNLAHLVRQFYSGSYIIELHMYVYYYS